MKWKKYNINIRDMAPVLVLASTPVLICLIVCFKEGIMLNNVYLANSLWNDEILYYKMIEAVAEHNQPLGYFGYNESIANIGRFGSWSPALFIFYIIYAKVFGWSMMSPIYCNIALMTIAMGIFACLVHPTMRQTLNICLLYCSCMLITRYVFSGMTEVSVYFLLIIYTGITIRMMREDGFKIRYVVCLNLLAFLLVIMRPYWLLLVVLPGIYCYQKKKQKSIVICEILWLFSCAVIYFIISRDFCAAYYTEIVKLERYELLFIQPMQGLYRIIYILIFSIWRILQDIGEGIVNGDPIGGIYALYFMAIAYFAYLLYKRFYGDNKNKIVLGFWMAYFCVMLLAIIYLYDIDVGGRHAMSFLLVLIFVIPIVETSAKRFAMIFFFCVWIFVIRATDNFTYQIPVYTEEKGNALQHGKEELEKVEFLNLDDADPWDNTIIWLLGDETMIDFTFLYALPGGTGIELCFKGYVLDNFKDLKPRYILTNIGEEVDLLCMQEGKERIAEYGNVHIWKLR